MDRQSSTTETPILVAALHHHDSNDLCLACLEGGVNLPTATGQGRRPGLPRPTRPPNFSTQPHSQTKDRNNDHGRF